MEDAILKHHKKHELQLSVERILFPQSEILGNIKNPFALMQMLPDVVISAGMRSMIESS